MAQLKNEIIGHRRIFDLWTRLLQNDQITGSFLFVGPSGVGKKKSAWAFAQQALCESPRNLEACGSCASCRRAEAHQHESILLVEPDGAFIKSEQAQDVLHFLQLRSIRKHRFVLIDDAHKMNPAAANTLLKTLEEPADGNTLILMAPSLTSVLPTIRSRTRVMHFQPVPPDEIKLVRSVPDWTIEASLGRFDVLEALNTTEQREFRTFWSQYFVRWLTEPTILTDGNWREALKNREEFKQALDLWLKLVRDAIFSQAGEKKSLLTLDLASSLQKLVEMPVAKLHQVGEGIIQLQKDLSFNKDSVLALEALHVQLKN